MTKHASLSASLCAGLLCSALACESALPKPSPPPGKTAASLTVTSKAFSQGGMIPVDYTCDGADRSVPLTWSSAPEATESFAIFLEDPDASAGTFAHWVAFNIPKTARSIPEGIDLGKLGASAGANDFQVDRYSGPCPPHGEMHRYIVRVFALDRRLDAAEGSSRDIVFAQMSGHVIAEGYTTGTFGH